MVGFSLDELTHQIATRLSIVLQGARWEIKDDSAAHRGHLAMKSKPHGGVTHCTLTIVSPFFRNMSPIQRHRTVQQGLGGEIFESVHSVSLKLKDPDE